MKRPSEISAIVAMPDPILGERACRCVVLKPDKDLSLQNPMRLA
jgi:non-ribosomal peptide synthetase component E (peptide arylation enzyme)